MDAQKTQEPERASEREAPSSLQNFSPSPQPSFEQLVVCLRAFWAAPLPHKVWLFRYPLLQLFLFFFLLFVLDCPSSLDFPDVGPDLLHISSPITLQSLHISPSFPLIHSPPISPLLSHPTKSQTLKSSYFLLGFSWQSTGLLQLLLPYHPSLYLRF